MRTITDHKVNGLNEALQITAGEPGNGGASHHYDVTLNVPVDVPYYDAIGKAAYDAYCGTVGWKSVRGDPLPHFDGQSKALRAAWIAGARAAAEKQSDLSRDVVLHFQNGPIQSPDDYNGITTEALIAVAIDRMRGFQHPRVSDGSFDFSDRGKFACRENACALTHLEEALFWLQKRTRDRMARGVEGTHKL